MKIHQLELNHFRGYTRCLLEFEKQINVFVGNNAQGKTNLLESIYFAATGKSHRTNQDSDLVQWEEPLATLHVEFKRNEMSHQVDIAISPIDKKIKLDGKFITKRSELLGQLPLVLFTPDDLSLVKGDPANRRRFLDFEISQTRPAYLYALQRYHRALKQRNISIRDMKFGKSGADVVHAWDEQLVDFGTQIMNARYQTLLRLNQSIETIYSSITGNGDKLQLKYLSQFPVEIILNTHELQTLFLQKLKELQAEEINRGITLVGPQRDDFQILLNRHELKSFGSQGEQRSTVLALKLAEIKFIQSELGEAPIVALDDFMSELDDHHIAYLLHSLSPDMQVFITAIHPLPNEFKGEDIRYYKVEGAQIS